jgi:hypothetical protein
MWRGVSQHSPRYQIASLVFCAVLLGFVEGFNEFSDISAWHYIGKQLLYIASVWTGVRNVDADQFQRAQNYPSLKVRQREENVRRDEMVPAVTMRNTSRAVVRE